MKNNEKYNQIIDEVYEKYEQKIISEGYYMLVAVGWPSTKEEFINKCKTDQEFSERWGLKIEERELSLEERMQIWNERIKGLFIMLIWGHDKTQEESLNEHNIPNKQITLTYQDEKIEVYE